MEAMATARPDFVCKVYRMIQECPNLIQWDNGRIVITSPKDLEAKLPEFFRHGKFTSFQRQLNKFGFRVEKHGATKETSKNYDRTNAIGVKKKHVSLIANDMAAYRKELGTGRAAPVSARMQRAWDQSSARGSPPRTSNSGRYSRRSTSRSGCTRARPRARPTTTCGSRASSGSPRSPRSPPTARR